MTETYVIDLDPPVAVESVAGHLSEDLPPVLELLDHADSPSEGIIIEIPAEEVDNVLSICRIEKGS